MVWPIIYEILNRPYFESYNSQKSETPQFYLLHVKLYVCKFWYKSEDVMSILAQIVRSSYGMTLYCYMMLTLTLMYAAETWAINVADMKKLEAFEMWCLRKMNRVSVVQGTPNKCRCTEGSQI